MFESLILNSNPHFSVFGFDIYYYGLITAISYLTAIIVACLIAKKRGFKSDDIITLACFVIPLAIIGARMYYCAFYDKSLVNFWHFRNGGLAFYGGMIGGALGVLLYCLIFKKNFLSLIDIIATSMILAQAIGRWGNFVNQEAFGYKVTNPNMQWFPFAVYIDSLAEWHLATFFYESLWNLMTFGVLMLLLYKFDLKDKGIIAASYLILYGIGRAWIEGLRTDSLYIGSLRVSQLLSIIFIAVGLCFVIYCIVKHKKQKKDKFDKIMDILKSDF